MSENKKPLESGFVPYKHQEDPNLRKILEKDYKEIRRRVSWCTRCKNPVRSADQVRRKYY